MMSVLLGLLARGVLSEKCFGYLLKVVERAGQQRVEPIRCHSFQTGGKDRAQKLIIVGINYHIVPNMPNVLDGVAHSVVIIKC